MWGGRIALWYGKFILSGSLWLLFAQPLSTEDYATQFSPKLPFPLPVFLGTSSSWLSSPFSSLTITRVLLQDNSVGAVEEKQGKCGEGQRGKPSSFTPSVPYSFFHGLLGEGREASYHTQRTSPSWSGSCIFKCSVIA